MGWASEKAGKPPKSRKFQIFQFFTLKHVQLSLIGYIYENLQLTIRFRSFLGKNCPFFDIFGGTWGLKRPIFVKNRWNFAKNCLFSFLYIFRKNTLYSRWALVNLNRIPSFMTLSWFLGLNLSIYCGNNLLYYIPFYRGITKFNTNWRTDFSFQNFSFLVTLQILFSKNCYIFFCILILFTQHILIIRMTILTT